MTPLQHLARTIYTDALRHVDARASVRRHLHANANTLTLGSASVQLAALDELLIIAVGKAALPMHEAAQAFFAESTTLPVRSVVVSPQITTELTPATQHLQLLPGAHPTPTLDSLRAAEAVLALLAQTTPRSAVLFLISGGASAMLERPLDPALPFDDLAAFHRVLVGSGLPIAAMNALRSHVSAVKGGRLAQAAAAAALQCTLLISDVPAASPHVIGSGPSLPDPSTTADCLTLLRSIPSDTLPASIHTLFANPNLPETPKPTDPAFARATWSVILSSDHLADAARSAALTLGFTPDQILIDDTPDDPQAELDYREAAHQLLARSAGLSAAHPRTCLISVGEVSVALPANPGQGGRNQQLALYSAAQLARTGQRATILSAGSDGIDGQSLAAGAVCDEQTLARAAARGLSVPQALAAFDTAPLLAALGASIVTGPTGNNLRDLRLLLTDSTPS